MKAAIGSTDSLMRQKTRKRFDLLLILFVCVFVCMLLFFRGLFPASSNRVLAQLYSWAARIAALMGSSHIAYEAANQAVIMAPQNVEYLNKRCWYGSLDGDVANVIADCYQVVKMEPEKVWARDTLGVALVFMKDYQGAKNEFQYVVDHGKRSGESNSLVTERKEWIEIIEKGEDPFTDQTVKGLLLQ